MSRYLAAREDGVTEDEIAIAADKEMQRLTSNALQCGLPDWAAESLAAWVVYARPLGDFLEAVVRDKLVDSFGRADNFNVQLIRNYAQFMYSHYPIPARGEGFDAWKKSGGLVGQHRETGTASEDNG